MRKLEVPMERLTKGFKWLYLIHIFFAGNSIIYDTPIEKYTSLLVVCLGAIVVLWRFMNIKKFINYPFLKLYMLFAVSFGLTMVVNWKYGWTSNFKILIWMIFQFAALYVFDLERSKNDVTKELLISLYIIIGFMTLANLTSIVMLFTNYLHYRILDESTTFLIGVAYWGRLYGVHTDPNYAAVASVVAIMAALYIFLKTDKYLIRILMSCSVGIQLMAMAFSASRTGMVTISVSMFMFFFLLTMSKWKKIVKAVFIGAIAVIIVFASNKGIVAAYNGYTQMLGDVVETTEEKEITETEKIEETIETEKTTEETVEIEDNSTDVGEEKKELVKIGREEELSGDISNRRFDLWNNSIQIFKKSPILGIGFGNIVSYAKEELPDCYLLTNGFSIFDAFHNMIMDLIASQGIVGIVIFLTLMLASLIYLIRNFKSIPQDNRLECIFAFSCCLGMAVSSMFVSHILYVNNQTTVMFWLLWGYLIYYVTASVRKNEKRV